MIVFACLSPHPPIILPTVGSESDRNKVKKTINSLEKLGKELAKTKPECIVITSPHPDWGFNVPLHFLTKDIHDTQVKPYLTDLSSPQVHFERGKRMVNNLTHFKRVAFIASGDMSHVLSEDGPYGFHPSGPEFDQEFMSLLKRKDIGGILNLSPRLLEEAAQCGLRSFCMLFGALESLKVNWSPKILSYEAPFGVGYLVADCVVK